VADEVLGDGQGTRGIAGETPQAGQHQPGVQGFRVAGPEHPVPVGQQRLVGTGRSRDVAARVLPGGVRAADREHVGVVGTEVSGRDDEQLGEAVAGRGGLAAETQRVLREDRDRVRLRVPQRGSGRVAQRVGVAPQDAGEVDVPLDHRPDLHQRGRDGVRQAGRGRRRVPLARRPLHQRVRPDLGAAVREEVEPVQVPQRALDLLRIRRQVGGDRGRGEHGRRGAVGVEERDHLQHRPGEPGGCHAVGVLDGQGPDRGHRVPVFVRQRVRRQLGERAPPVPQERQVVRARLLPVDHVRGGLRQCEWQVPQVGGQLPGPRCEPGRVGEVRGQVGRGLRGGEGAHAQQAASGTPQRRVPPARGHDRPAVLGPRRPQPGQVTRRLEVVEHQQPPRGRGPEPVQQPAGTHDGVLVLDPRQVRRPPRVLLDDRRPRRRRQPHHQVHTALGDRPVGDPGRELRLAGTAHAGQDHRAGRRHRLGQLRAHVPVLVGEGGRRVAGPARQGRGRPPLLVDVDAAGHVTGLDEHPVHVPDDEVPRPGRDTYLACSIAHGANVAAASARPDPLPSEVHAEDGRGVAGAQPGPAVR
jgi:hypothetical protein